MIPSPRQVVATVRGRVTAITSRRDTTSSLPFLKRRPQVTPVLPVHDLPTAVEFYTDIGFEVTNYDAGYAWVASCGWELFHLVRATGLEPAAGSAGVYVHVDDPDAWHVAISAVAREADVGDVVVQPWGMREFVLTDPSGNIVRFGREL